MYDFFFYYYILISAMSNVDIFNLVQLVFLTVAFTCIFVYPCLQERVGTNLLEYVSKWQ